MYEKLKLPVLLISHSSLSLCASTSFLSLLRSGVFRISFLFHALNKGEQAGAVRVRGEQVRFLPCSSSASVGDLHYSFVRRFFPLLLSTCLRNEKKPDGWSSDGPGTLEGKKFRQIPFCSGFWRLDFFLLLCVFLRTEGTFVIEYYIFFFLS